MASFIIDNAKIDFKKSPEDGKVIVMGKLALDGDGVGISDVFIVTVDSMYHTITITEKGKEGEGIIKKMTINWKNRKFDIHMDKADLGGVTEVEVTISIQLPIFQNIDKSIKKN